MTPIDTFNMTLRIPAGLAELLRAQALREHRSMNAEIVKAIEIAVDPRTPEQRQRDFDAVDLADTTADLRGGL
jgi:hypothetical protein